MNFKISDNDKKILLNTAADAINANLNDAELNLPPVSDGLDFKSGCFVSIHLRGRLRGCVGNFRNDVNIIRNVASMAVQAAFNDTRFQPLTADEFKESELEISVLSPMIPIDSVEEVEVGRDGIYIIKGYNKGVLLPQVATENKWDKYEFISQACLKAGLKKDAWKTEWLELYRFEAVVFGAV